MSKLAKKNNNTKYALKYIHPDTKNWGALAMMAGAKKYGAWNYINGHLLTDLLDAMERHIDKIRQGEWVDQDCSDRIDQTVPHLGCVVAGVNLIATQLAQGTLVDDRHDYLDKMAGDFDTVLDNAIEGSNGFPIPAATASESNTTVPKSGAQTQVLNEWRESYLSTTLGVQPQISAEMLESYESELIEVGDTIELLEEVYEFPVGQRFSVGTVFPSGNITIIHNEALIWFSQTHFKKVAS